MCWSVSMDVRTNSVSTTSLGSGTRSSKEMMLVYGVIIVVMVMCSPLWQLDSHRSRHGFTPVGELDQCIHFKVGESLSLYYTPVVQSLYLSLSLSLSLSPP